MVVNPSFIASRLYGSNESHNICMYERIWKNPCIIHFTQFYLENWPRGYKTFFMLNSVEHEIVNVYKYKNIKKCSFFQTDKPRIFPAHKC